jgi:hypothetical protein
MDIGMRSMGSLHLGPTVRETADPASLALIYA